MKLTIKTLTNRFDDPLLSEFYPEILACCPEYGELRKDVAIYFSNKCNPGDTILDIGAGSGDSALPLLELIPNVMVDLIDVSEELLQEADKKLSLYHKQINIINEDALVYLEKCEPYKYMHSAFTLHNFFQEEKTKLISVIFNKLDIGGVFVILDKIQPDEEALEEKFYSVQYERYKTNLPENVFEALIRHELEDRKEDVKMRESETINKLLQAGFKEARLLKRIGRDALIVCIK